MVIDWGSQYSPEWKNPETGDISSGYREKRIFTKYLLICYFLEQDPGTPQELFSITNYKSFSLELVAIKGKI